MHLFSRGFGLPNYLYVKNFSRNDTNFLMGVSNIIRGTHAINGKSAEEVEYIGDAREDHLYNVFHEDGFSIDGIRVDINPITECKTGALYEYLPGVEKYLETKQKSHDGLSITEKLIQKKALVDKKGIMQDGLKVNKNKQVKELE